MDTSLFMTALAGALWMVDTDPLTDAYAKLNAGRLEEAVRLFETSVKLNPNKAAVRKDLAYSYLKVGEVEAAREQFRAVMELDANDHHAALEYAFLCYETRERRVARLVFDRVRQQGDAESRQTAAAAFANVDAEMAAAIARWQKAAVETPDRFSVHQELAEWAEQRDELTLALRHYEQAWRLRPDRRQFLVDLARVAKLKGDAWMAFALAASRSPEPRVAERAREMLPARYPFASEFEAALALDPGNQTLRKELGFLHLAMNKRDLAEPVFAEACRRDENDLLAAAQYGFLLLARGEIEKATAYLTRVLDGGDAALVERVHQALKPAKKEAPIAANLDARRMAERSYQAGFLLDALKYYKLAQERNPADEDLMLRIGWTLNVLKRDDEAMEWFEKARAARDPKIAAEGSRAYRNLRADRRPVRTTFWAFPMFSSRWDAAFSYGQVKTELRGFGGGFVKPYISMRFVGDSSRLRRPGTALPGTLSEEAAIAGVGLSTRSYRGLMAWGEAGRSVSLFGQGNRPDYRAGVSYAKGFGHLLGSGNGIFFTTNNDAVFISRFDRNTLTYSQNRVGYTFLRRGQALWNMNCTVDVKRVWWGNFCETGPGLRWNVGKGVVFNIDAVRGKHLIEGSPRGADYFDLRAGFWYAITR